MAIEAQARVVLRGGSEAIRALQGVTRGTSAASKASKEAAKETERWQKMAIRAHQQRMREEERAAKASVRGAQQVAREKQRADREVEKSAERAAKASERAAERAAKVAEKASRDLLRRQEADFLRYRKMAEDSARRQDELTRKSAAARVKAGRDALRFAGGALGVATAGALAGGYAAANTARSIGGGQSIQERIQAANSFRERLVLTTGAAGIRGDARERVQSQVLEASTATGTDAGELMSVLETGHAQFNNLQFFADNLKEIATIAKSAGADTGEFAKAVGSIQSAFNLTGEDAIKAAYLMKSAADTGAIDTKDFAGAFAASAGMFSLNTKQKGLGGVRQFLGAAQGIGTGQFGGAESSTRLDRFITDLNDEGVRKDLAGIGIKNIADANGKVDVGRVLDQLAGNSKFKDAGVRQEIFKDVRGREGVETLLSARERVRSGVKGAVDFNTIANVSEQSGRDSVAANFADLQQGGAMKFQIEAAKMQAETVTHLDDYNAQLIKVLQMSNKLESAFGSLSIWASSIAAMGIGSAGTAVLGKVLGGGAAEGGGALAKALPSLAKGGTAAASGIGAALAAGSTTVAAAGGMAIAGTLGAGAAGGVAAGTLINQAPSWFRDDGQTLSDLIVSKIINGTRKSQLTSGGTRNSDGTVQKEIVRELKDINSGLRATNTKPKAGASREPQ